jgi:hypothetical protein
MKVGFAYMLWCPLVYHSPAIQRKFWTPEYTGEHRGIIGAFLDGSYSGLAYVLVTGMAPGRGPDAAFADDKLASKRSFRRCSSAGTSQSMVASPEFLEQPSADQ